MMLKKSIQLLWLAAAVFFVAACVEPMAPKDNTPEQVIPEGTPVRLSFGVPAPVSTKAFGAVPQNLESMHVFVFSKEGMFIAAEKATFTSVSSNNEMQNWYVDLPMGSGERHLHFVANLGADWELEATDPERVLIRSLKTTAGRDAYWQRVVLEHGIEAYKYDGSGTLTYVVPSTGLYETRNIQDVLPSQLPIIARAENWSYYTYRKTVGEDHVDITVNAGDYIQTNGEKVTTGAGLFASTATSDLVKEIPMVRNFARIRVQNASGSNFVVTSAALVNTPMEGYVAPYDDRASVNDFVAGWTSTRTNDAILASGYLANIPASGIDKTCPASGVGKVSGQSYVELYMYERGVPTEDLTAVLVCGTLNNNANRWVKIDLTDENGVPFPIFRDCTYTLTINAINGTDGYPNITDAYNSSSVGDIFGSPETATLTRVDDGRGLELWVQYVDNIIPSVTTEGSTATVTLLYRLKLNSTSFPSGSNVEFVLKNEDGVTPSITALPDPVPTAAYSGTDTPDSGSGWRQATFTLNNGNGLFRRSTVQVKGSVNNHKTLSRDITFRVLPPQDFRLKTTGLANNAEGQETTLTITLPSTLGVAAFPLVLKIEANNNCLTPVDDDLPAETGKSSFNSNSNTYYFLKTINYSDYQDHKVYNCTFKTTKAPGASGTQIRVTDRSNYFNPGTVDLKVGEDSQNY